MKPVLAIVIIATATINNTIKGQGSSWIKIKKQIKSNQWQEKHRFRNELHGMKRLD
jgi:hypothetical protein